ncbi:CsbD family protein [Blastomonas sp.]|uniref:CsbD family protein n=1 Tax=Blastomonas sp. TaxID=1909299 RepID=UPI0026268A00|nr:CsbD family protein [Blastomonas sp.]MDM7955420.1 CsbD family protein [Blastomonas sp.]
MGEFQDKAKGAGNNLAGKIKEGIGAATDNHSLEAEGKAQQLKGDAQNLKGDVKGALGDKA